MIGKGLGRDFSYPALMVSKIPLWRIEAVDLQISISLRKLDLLIYKWMSPHTTR